MSFTYILFYFKVDRMAMEGNYGISNKKLKARPFFKNVEQQE